MKKLALLLAGIVFAAGTAMGGTGWLSSYAYVWDGSDDTWYDLNAADQPENFGGADLGTFNLGYTLFLNAEITAWADGGDEYSDFSLWYRVNGGSWEQESADSIFNIGGNDWRGIADGNDLSGLGVGVHTVDLYLSRSHTWDGGTGGPYTTYLNELGDVGGGIPTGTPPTDNLFTATFEVIPEPGTMALFGIGLAALAGFRRRLA